MGVWQSSDHIHHYSLSSWCVNWPILLLIGAANYTAIYSIVVWNSTHNIYSYCSLIALTELNDISSIIIPPNSHIRKRENGECTKNGGKPCSQLSDVAYTKETIVMGQLSVSSKDCIAMTIHNNYTYMQEGKFFHQVFQPIATPVNSRIPFYTHSWWDTRIPMVRNSAENTFRYGRSVNNQVIYFELWLYCLFANRELSVSGGVFTNSAMDFGLIF